MSKKIKGIVFASLCLLIVVYLCYSIYIAFPGTPATIFMLMISLAGVLSAIGIYRRFTINVEEKSHKYISNLPVIEPDVLYVNIDDFVAKHEKVKGSLYVAGEQIGIKDLKIKNVSFDKLLDTFSIVFSEGVSLVFTDVKTVGVGDNQFIIFGFDQAVVTEKVKRRFKMSNRLIYELVGEEQVHFTLPKAYPAVVFVWEDAAVD
ncbi:MAG: hypothetical protein ACPGU5_03610 [Lishizhenia sp.]